MSYRAEVQFTYGRSLQPSTFVFGVSILGTYVAVAHAFMFCMGAGFVYSRNNTPAKLCKRGIKIYLLGYLLNFLRYGVYILGEGLVAGEFRSELWYSLYIQDILHFAGLAMMLTALWKWLKISSLGMLLISVVMSVTGSCIAFTSTGKVIPDLILGSFFTTTYYESGFNLFNWYLFVAMGMVFAEILCRLPKLDAFYRYTMILSGITMTVYIFLTGCYGMYFLTKRKYYYAVSTPEALGFLSIDLFLLSLFYFVAKAVKKERMMVFLNMSKNVNAIYVIHWCIIGFMDCIICYLFGIIFPYWLSYLLGFVILVVSYRLAILWKNKNRT